MEKKCFVALLMVVVMMCACWTGVLAEDVERETFTSGDYEYALLDDGTVEITGYNGKAEKLTIPNMLNGKKVTSIDNRAFYLCNSLISIIIPDSVAKISVNPFAYCSTLKSIFVSSEHPYFFAIDGVLFRKADSCLISYPKGREYTTYNIPQGITAIESSAFYDCKFLTRVTIPDSVTSIGDCAFSLCDSLTSITIPDSVEQIGTNPFTVCSALKSISVSPEHPYFATIDGVLFRKADKALISYPAGISSSTYTIPQGITAIGDSAFYYCDSLTSVSIPDSVTSIGDNAFYFCESLTSVTIPDSVTAIGDERILLLFFSDLRQHPRFRYLHWRRGVLLLLFSDLRQHPRFRYLHWPPRILLLRLPDLRLHPRFRYRHWQPRILLLRLPDLRLHPQFRYLHWRLRVR